MSIKVSNLIDCSLCENNSADTGCTASEELNRLRDIHGKSFASTCKSFRNIRDQLHGEIKLENALRFMLAGNCEFQMLSIKTGKKLRYRLEKRLSDQDNKCIYWVNTERSNGILSYAGVLYFDANDSKYKFGKGARGTLNNGDIEIKSLIFVLNKLYDKKYNMELKVFHLGKCGRCSKKITGEELKTGLCSKCIGQVPEIEYKDVENKGIENKDVENDKLHSIGDSTDYIWLDNYSPY